MMILAILGHFDEVFLYIMSSLLEQEMEYSSLDVLVSTKGVVKFVWGGSILNEEAWQAIMEKVFCRRQLDRQQLRKSRNKLTRFRCAIPASRAG